ncbi:MAG: nucleotide exchange factor GrpE [Verrucomicrobiae bacterium]|nr:nucleotide exchange factor GrpE [Verrucomicrobiae bacterium]
MTKKEEKADEAVDREETDVTAETPEANDSEAAESVENPAESARAEADKWRELALRSQADLENYRKRMAREKSEAIQYANVSLLSSLLPVLDNFEMGLMAAKQEGEGNIIYQGFLMVRKQIEDFLSENGVRPIEASGAFDPNVHEAVKQEPHDSIPEGEIVAELRRGYRLNDRLLRAANVSVSTGPAAD